MSKLIFGCGYLGSRVAKLWLSEGHQVAAVTRSQERLHELAQQNLTTIQADVTNPQSLAKIFPEDSFDTVLFSVGYDRSSDDSIHDVYAGGVKNVLAALPANIKRFIYISSIGVYGPAGGDWVDELTPPNPQRDGGKASLAAEQAIAAHPLASRAIILRMAGLYGPGRIPHLDKMRAGQPIAAPSKGWLNLIHIDDAASVVLAAEKWATAQLENTGPHIFCVTDGTPVIRGHYYLEVARRLGAPQPTFTKPDPNSPAAARAAANRRISNKKLTQTISPKLNHPTYRHGLASIL